MVGASTTDGSVGREPRPDRLTEVLAFGGLAGPILLVVSFTVAGWLRPGYSAVHHVVSDLGLGPHAWLVNGAGLANAVLLTGWVIAFFRYTRGALPAAWRWICAVLLELPPVGYALAALFTEAPPTLPMHSLGAQLALASPAVVFLVLGVALWRNPAWYGWSRYSLMASLVTAMLVTVTLLSFASGTRVGEADIEGMMERLLIVETLGWYAVAGWRMRNHP